MKLRQLSAVSITTTAALLMLSGINASAATLRGVVVHDNARAHSFVVAGRQGRLTAVHSRRLPGVGRAVTVRASQLHNGTWLAHQVRLGRRMRHAVMRGAVTFVERSGNGFVLSARGASLLVHKHAVLGQSVRRAADSGLAVGDDVTVQGDVGGGTLEATEVQDDGQDPNGLDVEGVLQAVDTTARTLTLTADDRGESGATVTVQVPASFDLSAFSVGETVELVVSPNPDGTFTLEQASDDSSGRHADNSGEAQGDSRSDQHASAEQQCVAEQSDPSFSSNHNGLTFTQFFDQNPSDGGDALGRCIHATAHGTAAQPSPEMQCLTDASDPTFASTHNGQTFTQFFERSPSDSGNAFGRCVNALSVQQSGSGSGSSGSGGAGSGSGAHGGSGSSSGGGDDSSSETNQPEGPGSGSGPDDGSGSGSVAGSDSGSGGSDDSQPV